MSMEKRKQASLLAISLFFFAMATVIAYRNWFRPVDGGDFQAIATAAAAETFDASEFNPTQVVEPFPAITDAEFVAVKDAADQVADNELVLGVKIGDQSRAYPINMLCGPQREIINDVVGNKPIAATW